MADVHSVETRSYNMSQIKGKNTKPEMLVRKFLHANGFRYRLHVKDMPGRPDIILPKYKTVIFINGCFWHGHEGCKYYVIPKTRTDWWRQKINSNINNDRKACQKLTENQWNVIVIWECELRKDKLENTLKELLVKLGKT
ncbi:T/G mismatch-specific endonuclease [Chitinophaga sp. YR627]|uniref:very short patch repair endonuclease n=1 Tax=Chitinophaga sp. YR627 TaxID=1881041 RepID=UPI0008EB8D5C|nr:very short patch repair endonuclease [Chitinophaga sp. YR627]SFO26207.1 T/G mismatch-specific endonuclease [Chitinophaga sp. YR627]